MEVALLQGPTPNPIGHVELRVRVGDVDVTAVILANRGVGVIEPPSLAVEQAAMAFAARFSKEEPLKVHRAMRSVRGASTTLPSCVVERVPQVKVPSSARFEVVFQGRTCEMTLAPSLWPVRAKWATAGSELSEEEWAAAIDACLLYATEHVDELRVLGFDTRKLEVDSAGIEGGTKPAP